MNNYNTSRDYELLWELASKGQKIVCEVDFEFDTNEIVRDVCRVFNYSSTVSGDITQVSTRGVTYIYAHGKDYFISQCKKYNLEFILPNAWISVKDRLPELLEDVLTCTFERSETISINFLTISGWIRGCNVTHWQPLPEPPREE